MGQCFKCVCMYLARIFHNINEYLIGSVLAYRGMVADDEMSLKSSSTVFSGISLFRVTW